MGSVCVWHIQSYLLQLPKDAEEDCRTSIWRPRRPICADVHSWEVTSAEIEHELPITGKSETRWRNSEPLSKDIYSTSVSSRQRQWTGLSKNFNYPKSPHLYQNSGQRIHEKRKFNGHYHYCRKRGHRERVCRGRKWDKKPGRNTPQWLTATKVPNTFPNWYGKTFMLQNTPPGTVKTSKKQHLHSEISHTLNKKVRTKNNSERILKNLAKKWKSLKPLSSPHYSTYQEVNMNSFWTVLQVTSATKDLQWCANRTSCK